MHWLPAAGVSGEIDWSTTIAPLDPAAAAGGDEVSAASTTSTTSPPTVALSTIKFNEGLAASELPHGQRAAAESCTRTQ